VIVPAVTRPFDLGNVVVRIALYINPIDGHVTAVSDPLPQIIDGNPPAHPASPSRGGAVTESSSLGILDVRAIAHNDP
jgi:hypothetical protein